MKNSTLETQIKNISTQELDYFLEWGSAGWKKLIIEALSSELSDEGNFSGKEILDIGARYGKMSCLFALLGANVTGIDIVEETVVIAQEEAVRNKVSDHTNFISYDGDLDIFDDNSFDLIFTKSVLVVIPKLDQFLHKINNKLRPGGTAIFIENGHGNIIFHALRKMKHGSRFNHVRYFKKNEIALFQKNFDSVLLKRNLLPPIYSVYCKKNK